MTPPTCPKCGSPDRMIRHSDGQWVCHATHVVTTPTIDERCDAQALAYVVTRDDHLPALLTADELRAVLVELENLRTTHAFRFQKIIERVEEERDYWHQKALDCNEERKASERQRDQWRECAIELAAPHYILEPSLRGEKLRTALKHYGALVRQPTISETITGSNERKGSEMPAEGNR